MMVTMLSVAMVSVFAADPGNLGTVTREEKSFGSLAYANNTFATKNSAGGAQALFNAHSGLVRNTVTGDAIAVIGMNRTLTATGNQTYSLGEDFEFSFDYF